jgi:hypothetical protein
MKGTILFIIFIVVLSLSYPVSAQEENKEAFEEKKFTSLHKSLILPGWGQIAEKRYIEGILFIAADAFCIYEIISNNNKGNKNYRQYKAAKNTADAVKHRELTEKYDKRRNQFILAAAGAWAVNLLDIYVIVRGKEKKDKNIRLKLKSGENRQISFTLSYSF